MAGLTPSASPSVPSFDTIAQDIINNILTVNPNVDVKIGAIVRDLFVDVQASQLQTIYSILNFSAQAQSVLYARGPQLDLIGYNNFQTRNQALRSVGALTLIIKNGVQAPTLLNVGDQFYTTSDQTGTIYTFICAQTTLLTTGTVQATIPIIALTAGSASNVPAYSITQYNYDFVDEVYNANATVGGTDTESDAAFAARIPTAITGVYTNVYNGIIRTIYNVENINPVPQIVTPDNPLSRGPYTIDVYLQRLSGYFGTPVQETAPANSTTYVFQQQPLYELNPLNQITVYDSSTGITTVIPQVLNGIEQYVVQTNPADVFGLLKGSIKANQVLVWQVTPPILPYTIDYNVDQTIIDAQTAYNTYNEVVADTLFRQARAIPIWFGASLVGNANAGLLTIAQNGDTNTATLFSNLTINESINPNNAIHALLQDSNLFDATLTNFDTTYEIVLQGSGTTNAWTFTPTLPTSEVLSNHTLTPLNVYWDNDTTPQTANVFNPFQVAGRLFIGNQDFITSAGYNFTVPTNKQGVPSSTTIQGVIPSWNSTIDTFYDTSTQTIVFNFGSQPPAQSNPTITFQIVQPNISAPSGLSYLTLAPSLVQPLVQYPGTMNTINPPYATVLPDGLDPLRAKVYKNGLSLTVSPDGVVGDYLIVGPDETTGVYTINFLVQPLTTDILQFGLLNPDLSISLIGN